MKLIIKQHFSFLIVFTMMFLSINSSVQAQNNWELQNETADIKLYTSEVQNSSLKRIKAEAIIHAPYEKVKGHLLDFKNYKKWYSNTVKSELLEERDQSNKYIYMYADAPWPISDRDNISLVSISYPSEDVINLYFEAKADFQPLVEDVVRVSYASGFWKLSKVDENTSRIDYEVHGDPGGSFPTWLKNYLNTDSPFNTLSGLKALAEEGL